MKAEENKSGITYHGMVAGTPMAVTVTNSTKKSKNTTPLREDDSVSTSWAQWYADDNNLFPQKTLDKIKADPELFSFIDKFVQTLYSGGLVYGKWVNDSGKRIFERAYDLEIETWLEDTNISLFLQEAFLDAKTFYNAWSELIYDGLGAKKGKIISLSVQDASFCRWGKQNSKGIKNQTFVSANWDIDQGGKDAKPYYTLNPYFKPYDELIEVAKDVVYYPLIIPGLPGSVYYQRAPWMGLLDGKIIELSNLIIDFKTYYLKNGMSLKYHVEVDEGYFITKYGEKEWKTAKSERKKQIIQSEIDEFNKAMTGIERTGKTIMSVMKNDPRLQQYSTWKITQLKPETVSNEYTNDMNQNTLIKLRALGLDPSLIGSISGQSGNIGGGSGSNSRVAWNIHSVANKTLQDIILAPLNSIIKRVNGWDKRIDGLVFMTESYFIATLDQTSPNNRM
jgi:hypothetical protein